MKISAKVYSVNDFLEWHTRKELVLSAKFQRRGVWTDKAKSYLIDTIISGFPIPKIFMHHEINMQTKKSQRIIIDGQQRLSTILSYLSDGFQVGRMHNKEYGGSYYSQLPEDVQTKILKFDIAVDVLDGASDSEILEMFARLNTYTVTLSKQEKLNSMYFGYFKKTVYSLGYEFAEFLIKNKILSQREVNRMVEAELSSELVIIILNGVQDKRKIESYYKEYDDEFAQADKVVGFFKQNMDAIAEIFGDYLPQSYFSQKHMFYTLFGVVDVLRKQNQLKANLKSRYLEIFQKIDDVLSKDVASLKPNEFKFREACTKHTTDSDSRITRHKYVLAQIEKFID